MIFTKLNNFLKFGIAECLGDKFCIHDNQFSYLTVFQYNSMYVSSLNKKTISIKCEDFL